MAGNFYPVCLDIGMFKFASDYLVSSHQFLIKIDWTGLKFSGLLFRWVDAYFGQVKLSKLGIDLSIVEFVYHIVKAMREFCLTGC